MILVGDGSHWRTVDVAQLIPNGISGLIWKATDGGSYVDPSFAGVLDAARRIGIPFAALHYQEGADSPSSELANITRVIPKDIPVVVDVEKNSGDISHTRTLVSALTAAGYHVPLSYIPRWYWEQIGKPSLAGLPPLWASHYVSGSGNPSKLYSAVPISWWDGYGGNAPYLLQFTDSGSVPGGSMGDFSLFNGDSSQFARLLDPSNFSYSNAGDKLTDNVLIPKGDNKHVAMTCAGYSKIRMPLSYGDSIDILQYDFVFDTPVGKPDAAYVPGAGFNGDPDGDGITHDQWTVQPDRPGPWIIPAGAVEFSMRVNNHVPDPTPVYVGLSN